MSESEQPLVSIVCLCYNHALFVKEALESVWAQTYPAIELIVVDDGSTDGSAELIRQLLSDRPDVLFFDLKENRGNCRAFNQGLAVSSGKYIIDLAADDVLLPDRVAVGVQALEAAGESFGVHFTDALYINPEGRAIRQHYKRIKNGDLGEQVPQGWVYADLLRRYFVCTPSMMMRHCVFEALRGYDESLAYEDFDFWIRSARSWQYCFTDQVLVKKRIVPRSWSARQYELKSRQLETTLRVCQKAKQLNRSREEDKALDERLAYEIRQAIRYKQFDIAQEMLHLKKRIPSSRWINLPFQLLIWLGNRFY